MAIIGDDLIDGRVLASAAILTIVTGVLSGLAGALQPSRGDVAGALGESGRGQVGRVGIARNIRHPSGGAEWL